MQYEKGLFAFFDSPDAGYRKALHDGDAIAQFTVTRITADGVELDARLASDFADDRPATAPAGGRGLGA